MRTVFVESDGDGVFLDLRVIPNASREGVVGWHAGRLKVKVQAPPERGKANRAVLRLLARELGVRAQQVELVAGATDGLKRVRVSGLSAVEADARIRRASGGRGRP